MKKQFNFFIITFIISYCSYAQTAYDIGATYIRLIE